MRKNPTHLSLAEQIELIRRHQGAASADVTVYKAHSRHTGGYRLAEFRVIVIGSRETYQFAVLWGNRLYILSIDWVPPLLCVDLRSGCYESYFAWLWQKIYNQIEE